jgi:hypothetical protein
MSISNNILSLIENTPNAVIWGKEQFIKIIDKKFAYQFFLRTFDATLKVVT